MTFCRNMRRNKWNYLNRHELFSSLVYQFGTHSSWPKKTVPHNKDEYEQFLADFADKIQDENDNVTTPDAVKQQISWAITDQPRLWKPIELRNYILNKAAA